MTSIIKADNISTVSGSGNITIPTGVKVIGTDAASIVSPGSAIQMTNATGGPSGNETQVTAGGVWTSTYATVSITPKYANSKIYLSHTAGGLSSTSSSDIGLRIQRAISGGSSSYFYTNTRYGYTNTATWVPLNWAVVAVDDAFNTTSQITYTIEIYKSNAAGEIRHCDNGIWTFVAMEFKQ